MKPVQDTDGSYTIDLWELLKVLWKKILLILICGALGAVLFFGYTRIFVKPTYRASITMYVNNRATEGTQALSSSDLTAAARLVSTYAAIIQSDQVMEEVANAQGLSIKPAAMRSKISTQAINNTEVFYVYVRDTSAQRAAQIANGIADIAPGIIAEIVEGSSAKVVDRASVPTARYSPNYSRNAILGGLLGALLAAAVVIVLHLMDDTIRGAADFERWDYPLLAMIPDLEAADEKSGYGYGYGYQAAARANKRKEG